MQTTDTFNIGIFLYDQVEELDFCGPFEVFKSAAIEATRRDLPEQAPWQVFTIAERSGIVKTSGGLLVLPHFTFPDHPRIDLLVIPGGNARPQLENPTVIAWLEEVTRQAQLTTSVCTGAFLLGKVGLLDGRPVTTHWGSLESLAALFPTATVQSEVRWVDTGTVVTAAGISAGIDMSLHLVERLLNREIAEAVARYMEYTWHE